MAPRKCCVGDCSSTSDTHRLYCMPRNDNLRNLWMSFLVPTNAVLLNLTKYQLLEMRVCEKHFDRRQFDIEGKRRPNSYPCFFTEKEIALGEPLSAPGDENIILSEHNYFAEEEDDDEIQESNLVIVKAGENYHEHPSCSSSQLATAVSVPGNKNVTEPAPKFHPPAHEHEAITATKSIETTLPLSSLYMAKDATFKTHSQKKTKFVQQCKKIAKKCVHLSGAQRVQKAEKYIGDKKIFENFHLLNKHSKTLLLMQLRNCTKKKKARRFTLQEKLMALLLLKQSPKEYKLLEYMFGFPNKRTLHRLAEKVIIEPGLSPEIFMYLKKKVEDWDSQEKLCTIVFDEVSLTPHLTYNEKSDRILGFVDTDGEREQKFCDHALIFMIRGICSNWRQSVAFYFCEGTTPAPTVQKILKELVSKIVQTGLIPIGLVCDQGSTFRTALKKMREDTLRIRNIEGVKDDGTIRIAEKDMHVFFDPPHLLKGLRNNFLTKNIVWGDKLAKWEDIEFVYDVDSKLGATRALPKLTAYHVTRDKIKKMKVSVAAQVFSNRTAAMLKYTDELRSRYTGSYTSMATTAEVVEFFDTLFDSVNGSAYGGKKGKMRKAVKIDSAHLAFWAEAISKLKLLKFEDRSSKIALQTGKPRLVRVPSLEGWVTTLESFIRLSKQLFRKYGVEYYYPRNINQDPLENFFGRIRALNHRNVNPDANAFIYAYKSLLITNVLSLHSKSANCEADEGDNLIDFTFLFQEKIFNKENQTVFSDCEPSTSQNQSQSSGSINREDVMLEKIKVQCSAYTAGYLCRKMNKHFKCRSCLKTYTSSSSEEGIHAYIKCREYKNLKNDNLVYPSSKMLRTYRVISQQIHKYLDKNCHKIHVSKTLGKIISRTVEFSWLGCSLHVNEIRDFYVSSLIKLQVFNWCKIINRILKGSIESKHVSQNEKMKILALRKHRTYFLRKKVLNK